MTSRLVTELPGNWHRVVYASECADCELCGEPICWVCGNHYADCDCPGPHQHELFEYDEFSLVEGNFMFARLIE